MFKNYLLTAWRSLVKQKLHSALNIIGLSVGLAASILMWVFAQDELAYDDFQPNIENSYRIVMSYPESNFGYDGLAVTSGKLRSLLESQYSDEIARGNHFSSNSSFWVLYKDNEKVTDMSLIATDSNINQFFQITPLFGSDSQALAKPDQLLLSRTQALRLFSRENVVGETLKLNNKQMLTIAGVFDDLASNSHVKIDAMYSASTLKQDSPKIFSNIGLNFFYTYVHLKADVNVSELSNKLGQYMTEVLETK